MFYTKFEIGDKVECVYNGKVGTVIEIRKNGFLHPVYTVQYPDGNEFAAYAKALKFPNHF